MRIMDATDCLELLAAIQYREGQKNDPKASLSSHVNYKMLPVWGQSPWGGENAPEGVWSWHLGKDQVLVGEGVDSLRIVDYAEARSLFS